MSNKFTSWVILHSASGPIVADPGSRHIVINNFLPVYILYFLQAVSLELFTFTTLNKGRTTPFPFISS